MPEQWQYEVGTSVDALNLLQQWGHPLKQSSSIGSIQAIGFDGNLFYGSHDPRRPGAGAATPATIEIDTTVDEGEDQ